MPRSPSWPPRIYPHIPTGQDRIRVNGRDYYLGPIGSTEAKAEYARLVTELAKEGKAGPVERRDHAPGLTVCEVLAAWWRYARTYYSERGRQLMHYRLALRPVERLFGTEPAATFGCDHLRKLQQALMSGSWLTEKERRHPQRKKHVGLCRRTVNQRIVAVRTVWRWAEEEGKLVPPGTWSALRVVKPLRKGQPGTREIERRRTTTLAEVQAVCKYLPPVGKALLLFQWWTGCRSGEHRIMRAGDVNLETREYRPREHKTEHLGHSRLIVFGPRAWEILLPWLERALQIGPDAPVFPTHGKHRPGKGYYTRDGYADLVRRAADAAGLPHFHAYLCRHATRMRVSKVGGDEAARAVLGQKWLDTALRYGELDADLARDVQGKIG